MLIMLALKVLHEQLHFRALASSERGTKRFGGTEIPVVLQDLILKNQMTTKSVPSQVGEDPVILVAVLPVVGEDEVRFEAGFYLLESILYGWPLAGKVTFPEGADPYFRIFKRREVLVGALLCFPVSRSRGAKDGPVNL